MKAMKAAAMVPFGMASSPRTMNAIRATIMALLFAILIGYLILWLMISTDIYWDNWLTKVGEKASYSTFFGEQGANMLLYAFPVLFMAVLGCICIHLGKNRTTDDLRSNGTNYRFAIWKRPVIIKGLGIVSRSELAFFVMFLALLVWSFSNFLRNKFHEMIPAYVERGEKIYKPKFEGAARSLGLIGNISLAFLFFPITRGSSVLALFGLTSEASVKYHIWLGNSVLAFFLGHSICYVVFWAVTNQINQTLTWAKVGISNLAGEISMLFGLLMWVATFPCIRRKMFELFFYTHHLYILFIIFYIFHVGIAYAFMIIPGLYLFLIDRYLRFLQSRKGVRLVSARILPCETIELNFSKSKGLNYSPTSIMFANVPSISKLQWHPFTITSNSNLEPETLSVVIRREGSWTDKLFDLVASPSSIDRLEVSIEGPYGRVSTDFLRHEVLILASGGSGVTPFISIIKELAFMSEAVKCKTPHILLISAFKNSSDLTMLDLLLPISGRPSVFSKLSLQIDAYVTREKHPNSQSNYGIRTLCFKPNPSDAPLTPILGKNGWLWLGAIISSSFIIFLILIGILIRYYIYPIDHNTNIYSTTSKAALNMLFMCISIVITASVAFLWNKRKNDMENKQIQNVEGTTIVGDTELESFPQQLLSECTYVHYGERPDLKRILFERKESSVGVFVCGPKKLRHEVASICQAGLDRNLHFEAISFSW